MSDEDSIDFSDESSPARTGVNYTSKVQSTVLSETDDEFGDLDEEVPEGRMTPSIKRAIRRSIFNMSCVANSTDEDEDEDISEDSEEASISEEEVAPTQKKRWRNLIVDSSDEESDNSASHHSGSSGRNTNRKSLPRKSLERLMKSPNILDSSADLLESSHLQKSSRWSTNQHHSPLDTTNEDHEENIEDNGNSTEAHEEDPDSGRGSNPRAPKRTPRNLSRSWTKSMSDSRESESFIIEDSTDEEEVRPPPPKPSKPTVVNPPIRPPFLLSSDEEFDAVPPASKAPARQSEVISIDSDTTSESEHLSKSVEDPAALSLARQEVGLAKVDALQAQRRAFLSIQLHNKEKHLAKCRHLLEGDRYLNLPDQGTKFLKNVAETEAEIAEIRKQLSKCRLVEQAALESTNESITLASENESSPEVHRQRKTSPLQHSLEDPEYIPYNEGEYNLNRGLLNRPTTAPMQDLGKRALQTFEREQALTVETLQTFHGSLNSRPTEDQQAEDPRGLKVNLMAHQKHALAWMMWREQQNPRGGVLADDMGLGKTLTMISLVLKSMESHDSGEDSDDGWKSKSSRVEGGTLVICPASLIGQWEGEVNRRCKKGLLNVELYHGTKRESKPRRLAKNDMVITTYNLASREHKVSGVLFKIEWKRIILDEGHVIRNHKSQVCEAVCAFAAKNRWVLSGTPIHNKEMDLYSVLKFLQCSPFNDIRVWKRWVDNKNSAGHERLATVMKTLMLRRTKQELMNSGAVENLPEKTIETIWVKLDPDEKVIYEKVMLYSKTIFAQFLHQRAEKEHMLRMGAGFYDRPTLDIKNPFNKAQKALLAQHADVKSHQILLLFLRLRQICCHPSLIHAMLDKEDIEQNGLDDDMNFDLTQRMGRMRIGGNDGDEDLPDGPAEVDERVTQQLLTSDNPVFERDRESSKLKAVLDTVQEILRDDEKVIIVSQWTSVLDIIAESLEQIKGASFDRLTGAVKVKDRGAIVDSFNNERKPRILLLSLTAGGVGLNLVGANHLILVDIHWNPQLESQAQDRIYRFGQKKNVHIYKFLCSDTIEEKIKDLQEHKLELAETVLSGSGKGAAAKLTMDDLKTIFGF